MFYVRDLSAAQKFVGIERPLVEPSDANVKREIC